MEVLSFSQALGPDARPMAVRQVQKHLSEGLGSRLEFWLLFGACGSGKGQASRIGGLGGVHIGALGDGYPRCSGQILSAAPGDVRWHVSMSHASCMLIRVCTAVRPMSGALY